MAWPLQKGRGFWTVLAATWLGIIGLGLTSVRKTRLTRLELRRALRPASLWRQLVTFAAISIVGGVDKQGRPFQIFTSGDARVVVNPQTDKVISVNPLSGAGAH